MSLGGIKVGKPSIFSKDYQKKMRRRKIRIALSVIVVIVIAAAGVAAFKGQLTWNTKKPIKEVTQKNENKTEDKTEDKTENKGDQQPVAVKEEGIELKLSDGTVLKAMYQEEGSKKVFKYLAPKERDIYYNINPSGNKMVVYDKEVQNIILVDTNGTITDITNQSYTSTSGAVITKKDVLSRNSSYIWCDSPKFVDDLKVVYISQLPWLNKTTKYLWMVDVETKQNTYVQSISGESIKFGDLEGKGLKVILENNILYLMANGQVSQ